MINGIESMTFLVDIKYQYFQIIATLTEFCMMGSLVGITAYAEDLDISDSVSYHLSDDAGGLFAIDSETGVVTLAGAVRL